jgi:sugar phosphate isomerase/epimerase
MGKLAVHPRVSVNGMSTLRWTLAEDIAFYGSAGIGAAVIPFSKFKADPQAGIDAIRASGLHVVSVPGPGAGALFIQGGEAVLEAFRPQIDAVSALNCKSLYFLAGPTPPRMSTDEAHGILVEALGPANAYARAKGVTLALEHNSVATRSTGFIHSLADAADLARDADIGICLELQNCWYERHLDRLFRENVDRFVVAQVSDFLVGEELRLNRRVPGDGSMPLEWMLERLLDAGYDGYFDLEILGPSIEAEGYASAIGRSVNWLSERLQAWGV